MRDLEVGWFERKPSEGLGRQGVGEISERVYLLYQSSST